MENKHPKDLFLLEYIHGERSSIHDHIENCHVCQEKTEQLKTERKHFIEKIPLNKRTLETEKQPLFSWTWKILVPAFSTICVLICVFIFNAYQNSELSDTTRIKGDFITKIFVKREDKVLTADEKFLYKPGDKLRIEITSPFDGYLSLYYIDNKKISVYILNFSAIKQKHSLLPGEIILDDQGTEEVFLMILSKEKRDLKEDPLAVESGKKTKVKKLIFKKEL